VSRAFASELLKLRTTRTFYALVASAVLATLAVAVLGAALGRWGPMDVPPGEDLAGAAFFGLMFALVLGLLAVTTEFRHGTIAPTLLAVPDRGRLMVAKVAAHLVAGLVLGLVTVLLDLLAVEAILAVRGIESGTSLGEAVRWSAGTAVTAALLAGIGVGVGALIRNQVGALVGGFAWLFLIEPLLTAIPKVGDPIARFGLGGLIDGADGFVREGGADVLGQVPAGLLLAAYAALAAALGAALLRRRDVTA
jgi:ABC-2 type transport system permease protein